MRLINSRLILVFVTCLTILTFVASNRAQDKAISELLQDRSFTLNIKDKTFQDLLVTLSREHGIAIGWQVTDERIASGCEDRGSFYFKDARIDQIMDIAITLCSHYRYTVTHETLNVFPLADEPSILDVRVDSFDIEDKSANEMLDAMFDTPQVAKAVTSMGIQRHNTRPFWQTEPEDVPRYSFDLSNRSVREIMNHIIANTNKRAWVYYRLSGDPKGFSLRYF